jgi:hypothetical protein
VEGNGLIAAPLFQCYAVQYMGHQGHGSAFLGHQVISVTVLETRFSAGCDLKTPNIKVIGKSHIIILADIELKDRLKARAG